MAMTRALLLPLLTFSVLLCPRTAVLEPAQPGGGGRENARSGVRSGKGFTARQEPRALSISARPAAMPEKRRLGAGLDPRLADARTFAFALGAASDDAALAELGQYDLVVLDGEAPASFVKALQDGGVLVLGYLSVGTIERGRPWSRRLEPYRLELWPDWDEWYAAVDDAEFRRIIMRAVAPRVLKRGFDGLFLDNVDMIENHPHQRRGMYRLVRNLSRRVHAAGKLLFAQNGDEVIRPVASSLDGWNREDVTLGYDFESGSYAVRPPEETARALAALAELAAQGILVTATDYLGEHDAGLEEAALHNACSVGALPFIADIGLTTLPVAPLRCADAE